MDRVGGTPLADAIREGHLDVVNFLRQHDAQLAEVLTQEDDLHMGGTDDTAAESEEEGGAGGHADDFDSGVLREGDEYPEHTDDDDRNVVDVLSESFGRQ